MKTLIHSHGRIRKLVCLSPIVLYPIWYFWRVFFPWNQTWYSTEASDLNYFVDYFRALGSSRYFFNLTSETYGYWKELDLLVVASIQALVQNTFGWLFTPVLGPIGTLNFYLFLGMCTSGAIAYKLTKQIGGSQLISVFAGLTVQSLPWIRQNILFGTACVFISVPLGFALLLTRTSLAKISTADVRRIGYLILFSFFFYSYWFFFGLFIVLAWLFISAPDWRPFISRLSHRNRIQLVISLCCLGVSYVVGLRIVLGRMRDANGKQLGVYPLEEVMSNINTLKGLITPDAFHLVFRGEIWYNAGDNQNYLGIFVAGFFLLRVIRVLRKRSLRQERTLLLIAVTCFIAAMGQIQFFGVTIPSMREILRYLMPGMRQFSRFGLIAQGIFVVLAWREVDDLLRAARNQRLQKVSIFVIGALILLDLNPASRRIVYEPPLRYQEINAILTNTSDPLVLIAQNSEPDPGIFDSRIVVNKLGIYAGLSGGLQEFTASLNAQKVTHIISDVAENGRNQFSAYIQDSIRMNLELPSNSFIPVSKSVRVEERDYFGGPIVRDHSVRLVGVPQLPSLDFCTGCKALGQISTEPPFEVVDPSINRSLNRTEWSLSSKTIIKVEPLPHSNDQTKVGGYFMKVQFLAPRSGKSEATKLAIEDRRGYREVLISEKPSWHLIEFDSNNQASVESITSCDPVSTSNLSFGVLEGKPICFGVADFIVFTRIK